MDKVLKILGQDLYTWHTFHICFWLYFMHTAMFVKWIYLKIDTLNTVKILQESHKLSNLNIIDFLWLWKIATFA